MRTTKDRLETKISAYKLLQHGMTSGKMDFKAKEKMNGADLWVRRHCQIQYANGDDDILYNTMETTTFYVPNGLA